ncbi:MAG TPA: sigma 54-interacting transcriptional regulator [Sandaracinaceae bacterium LLY-WYZ-13_1]|nr:sigma 54-interacting transcriptional regulator [Sandaracinaceae bacterium LLY-WYZ-13_1]
MTQSTQPSRQQPGLPIRSLRVEVVEGPDEGDVVSSASETLTVGTAEGNDLVLADPTVSRFHLELSRGEDGIRVRDHGSTNGTGYEGARLVDAAVPPGAIVALGQSRLRIDDGDRITLELLEGDELEGLRGRTAVMRRLLARVGKAAASDTPALLVGESGTGKELVARALHARGPRAGGPFVTVDCGALAPSLVASELFGHERGAFTGADRRHVGAFERADGGTLFLDEIGELGAELQPALLGVLERGRFRRVGGRDEVAVDARVIAATHRDLRAEVNAGAFRLDLYYRLAVVVLTLPPLRERAEDVPLLVEHFLREAGHDGPVEAVFGPDAMTRLCAHHWPGNVRELRNVVEATLAMGETPPLEGLGGAAPAGTLDDALLGRPYKEARRALLDEFERRYVARLLEQSDGNVSAAARRARMDRTYLIKLIQRHELK